MFSFRQPFASEYCLQKFMFLNDPCVKIFADFRPSTCPNCCFYRYKLHYFTFQELLLHVQNVVSIDTSYTILPFKNYHCIYRHFVLISFYIYIIFTIQYYFVLTKHENVRCVRSISLSIIIDNI